MRGPDVVQSPSFVTKLQPSLATSMPCLGRFSAVPKVFALDYRGFGQSEGGNGKASRGGQGRELMKCHWDICELNCNMDIHGHIVHIYIYYMSILVDEQIRCNDIRQWYHDYMILSDAHTHTHLHTQYIYICIVSAVGRSLHYHRDLQISIQALPARRVSSRSGSGWYEAFDKVGDDNKDGLSQTFQKTGLKAEFLKFLAIMWAKQCHKPSPKSQFL